MNTLPIFAFITIWIAAIIGYVMNIVAVFHLTSFDSGEAILRIIGIVLTPIGAVAGWF